jgi:hypothetical protein
MLAVRPKSHSDYGGGTQPDRKAAAGLANVPFSRQPLSACGARSAASRLFLPHAGLVHAKDLPILVAAVREQSPWLVTLNGLHFSPGYPSLTILRPGEFVLHVRDLLTRLTVEEE